MSFRGVDFYRMDDLLAEEEILVRDTVRRFVDEQIVPVIDKHFDESTFPSQLIPQMASMGLLGGNLPEEYGCANMNNVAYGLVMQELERGDSGIRSFVSVQGALVMFPIHAFGSDAQKNNHSSRLCARCHESSERPPCHLLMHRLASFSQRFTARPYTVEHSPTIRGRAFSHFFDPFSTVQTRIRASAWPVT